MEQSVEVRTVSPSMYAERLAQPFVADALYRIGKHFGCERRWTDNESSTNSTILQAEPLPASAQDGFGYGQRTGAAMTVDVLADMAHDEHTWKLGMVSLMQGSRRGSIALKTYVNARLEVEASMGSVMKVGEVSYEAMVCRGLAFSLPDGSSCVRLQTFLGELWLRPQQGGRSLAHVLNHEQLKMRGGQTYLIALSSCSSTHMEDPWHGLSSLEDDSDRLWMVRESKLHTRCLLTECKMPDRDIRKLYKQASSAIALEPPYDAVWVPQVQPDNQPVHIRLELSC